MSACADFGHPTHPGPHRFSHPAKSKFFSFLSDSEGNGKKLDLPPRPKGVAGALKSPKQKPLKNPSTAQIRRKSAANSRKSAQIRPPFCNSAPFRPTRPLGKTMKIANPSGRQYPPVCYLSFRWSVHLSVRPCFCLCACSPVVGRAACFLRLRPSASPPSSPFIKPSEFS